MVAATSAIEEQLRTARMKTWKHWLLWSKSENVVNTKISAQFLGHNEAREDEAVLTVTEGRWEVGIVEIAQVKFCFFC